MRLRVGSCFYSLHSWIDKKDKHQSALQNNPIFPSHHHLRGKNIALWFHLVEHVKCFLVLILGLSWWLREGRRDRCQCFISFLVFILLSACEQRLICVSYLCFLLPVCLLSPSFCLFILFCFSVLFPYSIPQSPSNCAERQQGDSSVIKVETCESLACASPSSHQTHGKTIIFSFSSSLVH